jgi:hypothetical protein
MPSARYYQQQAMTLLSWARATRDSSHADRLRVKAAQELQQAEHAQESVADLNPLLAEFNAEQMHKGR